MASKSVWPLLGPAAVAAGVIGFSHDYYYFTTIHLTSILALCLLAAALPFCDIAADRLARWQGAAVGLAIHLGMLVGIWVSVYLLFESCGIRAAADRFEHSLVTVLGGHLLQHAILPGLVWVAASETNVTVSKSPLLMLLPVTCFVAYSSYAQPCQIYPIDDPHTQLPLVTSVGVVCYAVLAVLWAMLAPTTTEVPSLSKPPRPVARRRMRVQ